MTSVTMTGAEFKRFYEDQEVWGENTFHDDTLIHVDGVNADAGNIDLATVADAARIEVESGEIVEAPPGVPSDLMDAIDWWRKRQTSVEVSMTVPREKLDQVLEALAALGIEPRQAT